MNSSTQDHAAERSAIPGRLRVGVDIGGTTTDAVAIDSAGAVARLFTLPTGYGPTAVVATAVEAVRRLADLGGQAVGAFESIGVGIPGRVDTDTGWVAHAVNLGLDGLDLGGRLADHLGVPVRVENDVNAAALGAYHLAVEAGEAPRPQGGHRRPRSMAYLNLGTGLAAGLVMDGALWRGSRGTAGEIGHIPVDPSGPLCACGQRGCLELMASGSAIARQWHTSDPQPVQHLFAAADSEDALAVVVRDRLLDSVASAVRVLVLTVDVEMVMIGGGIASVGAPLLDGVRSVLASRAQASPFLASLELADRVRLVPTGVPVAAIGAAMVGSGRSSGIGSGTGVGVVGAGVPSVASTLPAGGAA